MQRVYRELLIACPREARRKSIFTLKQNTFHNKHKRRRVNWKRRYDLHNIFSSETNNHAYGKWVDSSCRNALRVRAWTPLPFLPSFLVNATIALTKYLPKNNNNKKQKKSTKRNDEQKIYFMFNVKGIKNKTRWKPCNK